MKDIYILGINSAFHEPAACLLKNGETFAAVEEERFNRIRHGKFVLSDNPHELPFHSIDYCLRRAGISLAEVSAIGFSLSPKERLEKNLKHNAEAINGELGSVRGEKKFYRLLMKIPSLLEKRYKCNVKEKFHWIPHHLSHCASAFFLSPYNESAILSTDGIGEFTCTMLAYGRNNEIQILKEIEYPNSLGLLWTKASQYLNLAVSGRAEYGAGKVMALASYGFPDKFYDQFKSFVKWDEQGNFFVDEKIAGFRSGSLEGFEKLFGKPRGPFDSFEQRHMDFAAALQKITDEASLAFANYLYKKTNSKNLCKAGGVALNCVSNTHLLENSPFERIFVQPAANDMGTALGAAYYIWHHFLCKPRNKLNYMKHAYLGSSYSNEEIEKALANVGGIKYEKISNIEETTAFLIASGLVAGWFQGSMELGPRALGSRSILADPRNPAMYKKVSMDIKGREFFRPLAPSVLKEKVDEWFHRPKGGSDSDQFMVFSYKLRDEKLGFVPAITHVDNSGRLQVVDKTNEKFHKLIRCFFELTGIPMLVNTSFNTREPIVENPGQAIETFLNSEIDALAIGDYIIFKKQNEDKKCVLFESKGKAFSVKKFVENFIDETSLTTHEKGILLSAPLPQKIFRILKKPWSRAEWLRKKCGKTLVVEASGQRSVLWKSKKIKFKGCNPNPEKSFPEKSFFFGKEKESEGFRSFGVLSRKQVMRELLGWVFFQRHGLGCHQKPVAVYDYGENIGCCIVFETKGEKRIEESFDFNGITLADLVLKTKKAGKLPKQVGLKDVNVERYAEEKSSLLAEMNFSGGFRDLLNSNIGNDFLVGGKLFLGDFDSFRAIEIPRKPSKEFLKKFFLQCFVEAVKSSLPLVDCTKNNKRSIDSYLNASSVFKAFRKKFFAQAKARDWNTRDLKEIEEWAFSTPVFTSEARKMVPPSVHGMLNTLPREELVYKIH